MWKMFIEKILLKSIPIISLEPMIGVLTPIMLCKELITFHKVVTIIDITM